jgi:hypothetical protein
MSEEHAERRGCAEPIEERETRVSGWRLEYWRS